MALMLPAPKLSEAEVFARVIAAGKNCALPKVHTIWVVNNPSPSTLFYRDRSDLDNICYAIPVGRLTQFLSLRLSWRETKPLSMPIRIRKRLSKMPSNAWINPEDIVVSKPKLTQKPNKVKKFRSRGKCASAADRAKEAEFWTEMLDSALGKCEQN